MWTHGLIEPPPIATAWEHQEGDGVSFRVATRFRRGVRLNMPRDRFDALAPETRAELLPFVVAPATPACVFGSVDGSQTVCLEWSSAAKRDAVMKPAFWVEPPSMPQLQETPDAG